MSLGIYLTASVRSNLLTLSDTTRNIDTVNGRLSSGLRVRNAIDDAVAFYASQSLDYRSQTIGERKSDVDQAVSALGVANTGIEGSLEILQQIKGILTTTKSSTEVERAELTEQFKELFLQFDNLVNDSSYQGLNLISNSTQELSVEFSENPDSGIDIQARNLTIFGIFGVSAGDIDASLTAIGVGTATFSALSGTTLSSIDDAIDDLKEGIQLLRGASKTLGSNITLLRTRLNFSEQYINNLIDGSNKLRLSDTNKDGAYLVALQTRQQLGIQALTLAANSERSVLRLFA